MPSKTAPEQRGELAASLEHFRAAARAMRSQKNYIEECLRKYGDGNGREMILYVRRHFPPDVRAHLRMMRREISASLSAGFSLRPRGVHIKTMKSLRMLAWEEQNLMRREFQRV